MSDEGLERRRPRPRSARIAIRFVLIVLVPLVVLVAVLSWYAGEQRFVRTDNAYVKADLVAVSGAIDGRVVEVLVHDDERVEKGALLLRLDPRPRRVAVARAEAKVAEARNEVLALAAQYAETQHEMARARERVAYFQRQVGRERSLAGKGLSSESSLDEIRFELRSARQEVAALEQRARRALAEMGGRADLSPESHPRYLEATAVRDQALLALEDTEIRAPASGRVSRMRLQPGEWVESGKTLFTVVEDGAPWVEANLKETQLTHVETGQPVELRLDAYPDRPRKGHIGSISAATGSQFLVLPAQNATGNWVKVVQRVPVHIDLDPGPEAPGLGAPELRAGMTVSVTIDTGRESEWTALLRDALGRVVAR